MILRNIKNKVLLRSYKLYRLFKNGHYNRTKLSKKERTLKKILKEILENQDSRIYYSPESYRIFTHNKEKTYIISFDGREVRITNHKSFSRFDIHPDFGKSIVRDAFIRIESDMKKLEREAVSNEDLFLDGVYDNFKNTRSEENVETVGIPERYFQSILEKSN
jgi:hypothetical protein